MLRYTAAMMIAAYAGWLARSLRSGAAAALLPGLLQLLTAGVRCRKQVAVWVVCYLNLTLPQI